MKGILALIIAVASLAAVAQQAAPPTPQATKLTPKAVTGETAQLKSELAKANAQKAWAEIKGLQLQANQLQTNYQNSLRDLQAKYANEQKTLEAYKAEVCKENGWVPTEVNYDAESDQWTKLPPPAKPEAKPAEKK